MFELTLRGDLQNATYPPRSVLVDRGVDRGGDGNAFTWGNSCKDLHATTKSASFVFGLQCVV